MHPVMGGDWGIHGCISSLSFMGEPIIMRNIRLLSQIVNIENVAVPKTMPYLKTLVQSMAPEFEIDTYDENGLFETSKFQSTETKLVDQSPAGTKTFSVSTNSFSIKQTTSYSTAYSTRLYEHEPTALDNSSYLVPLNSIIYQSENSKELLLTVVTYPWEFLDVVQKVMRSCVKKTIISSTASVAKTSIIEDPCIIEDDVIVDDFCKIKGSCYIGKGSFVGMSSLIRNCVFENNVKIGFNCEIAKSYFKGHDKIAHQNVILDSVIGKNVWFGGFSGTANVLLDRRNIRYEIGSGKFMDIGRNHFGALVGDNSAIGAAVIILPGRYVPNNSVIQAGTIYCKNEAVTRN
jgi:UDP-N-acetylglucosamine diphosphorylase / glucose-1-phosphate thymidylyltransferase / UDP-N-acetylgalactosamine diphosphorylase / glucosamine-1-phosphate N-acetyltransferase / galactosamine-1-phosphate N-acetyltransferase